MKTRDIKTIDVQAKEWFDKANGNSYFSTEITINLGLKNQVELEIPFTYGYDDYYRQEAFELIKEELNCFKAVKTLSYWRAYAKYNIITRHNIKTNCLKRELIKR